MVSVPLQQGMIVWAVVADRRGVRKRRPVVIVTSNQEIAAGGAIVGVAITTSFTEPPPVGHVQLPWDPTGRSVTRLRRRSAAVCEWLVAFEADQVDSMAGAVPPQTLLAILKALPKDRGP